AVLHGAHGDAGGAESAYRRLAGVLGDGDGQSPGPGVEPVAAVGGTGGPAGLRGEFGGAALVGQALLGLGAGQAEVALHRLDEAGGGDGGGGGGVGRVLRGGGQGARRGPAAEQQEGRHAGMRESGASHGRSPSSFQRGGVEQ